MLYQHPTNCHTIGPRHWSQNCLTSGWRFFNKQLDILSTRNHGLVKKCQVAIQGNACHLHWPPACFLHIRLIFSEMWPCLFSSLERIFKPSPRFLSPVFTHDVPSPKGVFLKLFCAYRSPGSWENASQSGVWPEILHFLQDHRQCQQVEHPSRPADWADSCVARVCSRPPHTHCINTPTEQSFQLTTIRLPTPYC